MAKVTAIQVMKDAIALKEKKSKDYQGDMWTCLLYTSPSPRDS